MTEDIGSQTKYHVTILCGRSCSKFTSTKNRGDAQDRLNQLLEDVEFLTSTIGSILKDPGDLVSSQKNAELDSLCGECQMHRFDNRSDH